ncbi:MAG: LysM peptidoglycan-binding domain-containing protein [Anaerolineaceae bacterium]
MKNQKRFLLPLSIFVILLGLGIISLTLINFSPAEAQATYQTPTPDANGRIYYTVEEGDTCTKVYLLTNVTISDIIRLNGLDEECTLVTGTKILLGTVAAPALTETAMPTATTAPELITPTPTPAPGFAKVCVVLFNDLDGTGMRTEGETYLYGGVVSLNDRLGNVSLTGNTVAGNPDEVDPLCFENIPEGSYNITVAIPDGFNATTITNYPLEVKAGEQATVDFGAQVASSVPAQQAASEAAGRVPVLGIVGLVLLLAGLGLGFYMWRQNKI